MSISITFYIQIQYLNILLNMTWHGGFYKCRRYYRWNPAVHNLRVLHGHRLKWTYISLDDSSIFYTLNDGAIDTTKINFLLITFLIFQFKYLQYTRLIKKWFSNSWIKAKLSIWEDQRLTLLFICIVIKHLTNCFW